MDYCNRQVILPPPLNLLTLFCFLRCHPEKNMSMDQQDSNPRTSGINSLKFKRKLTTFSLLMSLLFLTFDILKFCRDMLIFNSLNANVPFLSRREHCFGIHHRDYKVIEILCLSSRDIAPTRQRPLC